jgi:hypothetical protein
MAINVNTVYTTVLSILNKEQRGYITPDEFNKLATQVQLEMFENYFEDLNQQLRVPQTESEYADRRKNIDNNISIFKTIGATTTVPAGRITSLSLTNGGTGYVAANGVATTVVPIGGTGLTVNTSITLANNVATTGGAGSGLTVNITSVNSGVITGVNISNPGLNYVSSNVLTITGGGGNAQITLTANSNGVISNITINNGGSGYSVGDVITISTGGANATATVQAVNSSLYFLPPSNLHRIGAVIYRDQGVSGVNTGQPHIYVYPKEIQSSSDITVSYIRKPSDVVWGFTVGALNQYVYNQGSSTQFELDSVEQNEVILRILSYAGVVIRDPQIIQAAAQAVQAEEINSKS